MTSAAVASLVSAQEVSDAPSTGDTSTKGMEQVLVTAQKQVQRLQDVPIPVTVLDAETLADNNENRLQDYFATVPGLTLVGGTGGPGGGQQELFIRGLSTGFSATPSVSFVIDDVPFGGATYTSFGDLYYPDIDPSDLARVEVLRGPQGTLYGADNLGGVVKVVTQDPSTSALKGRIQVEGQDIPEGGLGYAVRGAINIPISDTVAIRASGFTREDPGYIENVTTGQKNVNSALVYGGRLAALWSPSADFSLKLSALYQDTDGRGSTFIDANSNLQPTLGDLTQTEIPGTGQFHQAARLYTATVHANLGSVALTSISGYAISKTFNDTDYTNSYSSYSQPYGVSGAAFLGQFQNDKFTQEIRLSSSVGKWFDWVLGGFYTHERNPDSYQIITANSATTGAYAQTLYGGLFNQMPFSEDAVFVNFTTHVTDRFDIQLGGRESWNHQSYGLTYIGPLVYDFFGLVAPYTQTQVSTSGNAFTYLVTPEFKVSPDLMTYIRIASGYRIGGPNYVTLEGLPPSYAPDKTVNYELGAKGDIHDHLLSYDVSVYYIDWKNMQLSLEQDYQYYIGNGSRAKSEGVELSIQARPYSGLVVAIEGDYNDAALTQSLPASSTAYGTPGEQLPYSSRFSGSLSIDQDVFSIGNLTGTVGASVSYVDKRFTEFLTAPVAPGEERQVLPTFTTTNLRASLKADAWSANLFLNNLTDRRGLLGGFGATNYNTPGYFAQVTQPRTVGLSIIRTF